MKIREVAGDVDSNRLLGLVDFLAHRAEDENATMQISQDAFINAARSLGIPIDKNNIGDAISREPLSNLLEPLDPTTGQITFKGAGIGPTAMPVNQAQDIVAAAAKRAMK
jgi:hypothetical protein